MIPNKARERRNAITIIAVATRTATTIKVSSPEPELAVPLITA
jgi:hypothetical protein